MHRFFAPPGAFGETHVQLDGEILDHIRVLRLGPEEVFIVCDGAARDYRCVLAGDSAQILSVAENLAEPRVHCVVHLAYTRGERMDFAIQKSVELGAGEICLFPAKRCVVKYDEKNLLKKVGRWEKIALEAAKQSGRGRVPPVIPMSDFKSAMECAAKADLPLFLYENEAHLSLGRALDRKPDFQTLSLVVGPEGGFDPDEAESALGEGLSPVTLGKRILRCETAPAAALAAVMFYVES